MPCVALTGVLPVVHTPFRADGAIDRDALGREVEWVHRAGAGGVVLALASDLLRLTPAERAGYPPLLAELNRGRGELVVSVGAETAAAAAAYARAAAAAGATAVMAIPPVDAPLAEPALEAYFRAIADAVPLPLIVQDASGYVGRPLSLALQAGLLKRYGPAKVLFKPESAPPGPAISALRDATGGEARILDGSGGIDLMDAFRRGVVGTVPGCDLLDGVVALWRALEAGDEAASVRLQPPIASLIALQLEAGLDGFLAVERYLMVKRGVFTSDRPRLPVSWTPGPATLREVDRRFGILQAALA